MFRALRAMLREPEGKVLVVGALVAIGVGTVAYTWLEGWSPIDALYFSVVTLATVGFGDLHPTTDASKVFTVLYILSGLGIIAAFASELSRQRSARTVRRTTSTAGAHAPQPAGEHEHEGTDGREHEAADEPEAAGGRERGDAREAAGEHEGREADPKGTRDR